MTDSTQKLIQIDVNEIVFSPFQTRRQFSQSALEDLAKNIRSVGLINPITVMKVDSGYVLTAGERRLRATRLAGLPTIRALVIEGSLPSRSQMDQVFSENMHRSDLNPLEVAEALQIYKAEFNANLDDIVKIHGGSTSKWSRYLKVAKAPESLKEQIRDGHINSVSVIGMLVDIYKLNADFFNDTLNAVINRAYSGTLEAFIKNSLNRAKSEGPLGYLPPIADSQGRYNESHKGVLLYPWQGEYGVTYTLKLLQISVSQWVGGYELQVNGSTIQMPLSNTYSGNTQNEVRESIADQLITYLDGLSRRVNESRVKVDIGALKKHLFMSVKDDELKSYKPSKESEPASDGRVDITPDNVCRQDDYIEVTLDGRRLRLSIKMLKALL